MQNTETSPNVSISFGGLLFSNVASSERYLGPMPVFVKERNYNQPGCLELFTLVEWFQYAPDLPCI